MHRRAVDQLPASTHYWVPAVIAPERGWAGMPSCRRGGRFMVDCASLRPSRDEFEPFESELSCLQWIMLHRRELNERLPGVRVRAVALDRWLLGLD